LEPKLEPDDAACIWLEPDEEIWLEPDEDIWLEPDEDIWLGPDEDLKLELEEDTWLGPEEDLKPEPEELFSLVVKEECCCSTLVEGRVWEVEETPLTRDSEEVFLLDGMVRLMVEVCGYEMYGLEMKRYVQRRGCRASINGVHRG